MSNWFKKFFGLNDDNEDNTNNRLHNDKVNKDESFYPTKKKTDAKVVYDYPKGNFRFPVIPDDRGVKVDSQPRRRVERVRESTNDQQQAQASPKVRATKTTSRNIEKSTNNDKFRKNTPVKPSVTRTEYRNERSNKKIEPTVDKKSPFKLTEVPSPVYGFKKPEVESVQPEIVNDIEPKVVSSSKFGLETHPKEEVVENIDIGSNPESPVREESINSKVVSNYDTVDRSLERLLDRLDVSEDKVEVTDEVLSESIEEDIEEISFVGQAEESAGKEFLGGILETDVAEEPRTVEKEPTNEPLAEVQMESEEVEDPETEPELEPGLAEDSEVVELELESGLAEDSEAELEMEPELAEESEVVELELESGLAEDSEAELEMEPELAEESEVVELELETEPEEEPEVEHELKMEPGEEPEAEPKLEQVPEEEPELETAEVETTAVELQTVLESGEEPEDESKMDNEITEVSISEEQPGQALTVQGIEETKPEILSDTESVIAYEQKGFSSGEPENDILNEEVAVSLEVVEQQPESVDANKDNQISRSNGISEQETNEQKVRATAPNDSRAQKKKDPLTWNGQVVPFNVLMFNRDKKKLNHNNQRSEPVQAESAPKPTKPTLNLLDVPPTEVDDDHEWIQEQSELLDTAFASFNVGAKVVKATKGPAVTQFEVHPEIGVRVNKITNLSDDLKLALAAKDIRIEAPIPGKNTIGIEVPNRKSRPVLIREILRSPVFQQSSSPLAVAMGLDISGQPVVTDLQKMPHGLIAGATGSGKSVCINSIIVSLLFKASPHEVKLLLIDPKMVELAPYNDIPHLVSPVITDVKAATAALKWAVEEMERRYELFAHEGVRDISRFNEKVLKENEKAETMPYLVIIIDELADLMMVSPADVEDAICRIAQKARACGIHLLLATQRPSVDVITGLIKANIPTRVAFSVSSQVDSRTIIDISGAEKLLGKGDMLLLENGSNKPVRVQGNFVTDEEIERVTEHVRNQSAPNYLFVQEELIKQSNDIVSEDELFIEACEFIIEQEGASASSIQRRFRVGYNRAARLIDMMESQGIVSEAKGSKPRDVLITKEQLEQMR